MCQYAKINNKSLIPSQFVLKKRTFFKDKMTKY